MTPFEGTSTCIETARPLQLLEALSSVCALVFLSSRSLTSLQTSGGPLTSSRITPDSLLPFVHPPPLSSLIPTRIAYYHQRKFSLQNFRVTDIQQLFNHHSSYTTHQISWQVQQFVNLHVQISWQVQYKMRFREIADARNAVFFNRTGGFEPGKSSSAERLLRDGLGSWSVGRAVHCD